MPRWQNTPLENRRHAQDMRRNPTDAEKRLWHVLNRNQLTLRFRRQHPIGPYIVDFCCPSARLIIELDGPTHHTDDAVVYDARRDEYLRSQGYRVYRVPNNEVHTNLHGVVATIYDLIHTV